MRDFWNDPDQSEPWISADSEAVQLLLEDADVDSETIDKVQEIIFKLESEIVRLKENGQS